MFSIITPTYNRADTLRRMLNHLFAMEGIDACEVIVVDDGSEDHTQAVLAEFAAGHANLKPRRQANGGPGVARDTGLAAATGERILFIDDDVFASPDLLLAHARFLDQGFDLSQGDLRWTEELAGDWVIRFMDAHGMQFNFDRIEDEGAIPYQYVYTANLAVNRCAIDEAGGFDAELAAKRYAFEDTALAFTLRKNGCRMGFNREARAQHHHPMTEEGLAAREYKVGYALNVLRELYPEIYRDLAIPERSPARELTTAAVRFFLHSPLRGLCGRELQLRLKCRDAFEKGRQDYEKDHG